MGAAAAILAAVAAVLAALISAGVLFARQASPAGSIDSPTPSTAVDREFTVVGRLSHVPAGEHVWVADQVDNVLYPKEPEVPSQDPHFSAQIVEGGSPSGGTFTVVLLMVGPNGERAIEAWLRALQQGASPRAPVIPSEVQLDAVPGIQLRGSSVSKGAPAPGSAQTSTTAGSSTSAWATIQEPSNGARWHIYPGEPPFDPFTGTVSGHAREIPAGWQLWVVITPPQAARPYHPQPGPLVVRRDDSFSEDVGYAPEKMSATGRYAVRLVLVDSGGASQFSSYLATAATNGDPGLAAVPYRECL